MSRAAEALIHRMALEVHGVVQGVGFRPFVYNAARARGLSGWVRNEAGLVRIEVQGGAEAVADFCRVLREAPPPQARLDRIEVLPLPSRQEAGFEILDSPPFGTPRPTIPTDLATCPSCLEEIRTPGQRRFRYPFTNCTNCGPRWSIIQRVPYDRAHTSMARFVMCARCRAEYEDPSDRRFHAQPIACPDCGPHLELADFGGRIAAREAEALDEAARSLLRGQIVAVKGLGGFQLIVDATDPAAVVRLRQRKHRPHKPLAVMMGSLEDIRASCQVSVNDARELTSPRAPIVLLRRIAGSSRLADAVAPGNPDLGVMLPYTPLHHLLMDLVRRPIVCTSGNLSEEPMALSSEEARQRLGTIADWMLTHDRPIVRPVDDSVVRLGPEGVQVLRRARGYAPLPLRIAASGEQDLATSPATAKEPVRLALGGHLKNAVALGLGSQVIFSSHVGDLDNVPSVAVHRRAIDDLIDFFAVRPEAVACDLHPDYASTREAEGRAAQWQVPLVRVQHHHAHVAACMAEQDLDGPVLGLAWDGTGYGPDGTAWGGEVLLCEGAEYRRLAHLRTFPLPGGDRAAREPRRAALGLLFELLGQPAAEIASRWFAPRELATLLGALNRGLNCPRTSSVGRLFDAVAALCGLPDTVSFEGQAAMALEFAADRQEARSYTIAVGEGSPSAADWSPMVRAVLGDLESGLPVGIISAKFHNALAGWAAAAARCWGDGPIVLTGGCFQNTLLTERVRSRLLEAGHRVYTHLQTPPGDGGIALGQWFIAARRCEAEHVLGCSR